MRKDLLWPLTLPTAGPTRIFEQRPEYLVQVPPIGIAGLHTASLMHLMGYSRKTHLSYRRGGGGGQYSVKHTYLNIQEIICSMHHSAAL